MALSATSSGSITRSWSAIICGLVSIPDGAWRIYKLRPDFHPADKVQVEDDITASTVLPKESLGYLDPEYPNRSVKLVTNCETLLFQRPDDAIHRGFDKQAEADIASAGTFLSNFEPLDAAQARVLMDRVVEFDEYTEPMKDLFRNFVSHPSTAYLVSSAHPRIVDGSPSKNPRYLQRRPDLAHPRESYLAEVGTRLAREIPAHAPVHFPVNAVLAGRRNNPPDAKGRHPATGLCIARFTIRNCPNCSWTSSAVLRASRRRPPALAVRAR